MNATGIKELIMPLKDVLIPLRNGGTKHVIEGLVKENGAKAVETYINLGINKNIKTKELIFEDGTKAIFSEKKIGANTLRTWKHADKADAKVLTNADGDILSFKAHGYCWNCSGETPEKTLWNMSNHESTHRKNVEISRVECVFRELIQGFFKF